MNKYFIDCGFYVGKALDYYAPLMDESWKVVAFEPNQELWDMDKLRKYPFPMTLMSEAVWIEDTFLDFAIGKRDDASHIKDIRPTQDETINVKAIDFSRFISELPEDSTIVVSMDCEGAEFPVLRKMLRDGTAKMMDLLDVEFHHRIIEGESEATASLLRQALEAEGVLVKLKIEP